MKKTVKLLALPLALCMLFALAACGGGTGSAVSESKASESVVSEAPAEIKSETPAAEVSAAEETSVMEDIPEDAEAFSLEIVRTYTEAEQLPLVDKPTTLTAWDYVVPPVMAVITDYGKDGQVYVELQERTGVTLDFTTANLLTASDDMSLMVNANDLPDIVFNFGMFYSNNLDDLIDGDIIVNYKDYEDIMPNYFDIINNNPSIARDIYTAEGNVPKAENIQDSLIPSSGPAIRQDWLDADGLEVPVTVDELHDVLLTFQSENDCAHPFWIAANGNSSLNSAFGISYNGDNNGVGGWTYEDGQMVFSLFEEGFRDYVQLMADWYVEGLISPDFVSQTMNNTATDDEIVGNAAGFFNSSVNGLTNLSGYEPDSDVQPVRPMVLNEGDLNGFDDAGTSRISKGGTALAGNGSDIELACRIIDYLYSDDGILLCNYGVEHVTFEFDENGDPQLTELVTDNPEYDFTLALIKYTSSTPTSICINERNFLGYTDAQVKALDLWIRNTESVQAPGAVWSVDAQTEAAAISSDAISYISTEVLKMITGSRPVDEWDDFVEEVKTSFDIERLIELNQEAVETYLAIGT